MKEEKFRAKDPFDRAAFTGDLSGKAKGRKTMTVGFLGIDQGI
jgi:hypothetical protein